MATPLSKCPSQTALFLLVLLAIAGFVAAGKYNPEFRPAPFRSSSYRNNRESVDVPPGFKTLDNHSDPEKFEDLEFREGIQKTQRAKGHNFRPSDLFDDDEELRHHPQGIRPAQRAKGLGFRPPEAFTSLKDVHQFNPPEGFQSARKAKGVELPSQEFSSLSKGSNIRPSEAKGQAVDDDGVVINKKYVSHLSTNKASTLSSKGASVRTANVKSFAVTADKMLGQLSQSDLSSKSAKLSVDTFQRPNSYRAGLEIYHSGFKQEEAKKKESPEPFSQAKLQSLSGDVPTDITNTLNNITNPNQIIGTVQSLDWSTGTAGVVLIIGGIIMALFGYRLFKIVLFIGGFFAFGALAYIALNIIRNSIPSTAETFANNGALIYLIVVVVVGALGGGLTVFLWRVGLSVIGGLLGFVLATTIEQFIDGGLIKSEIGRIIFIAIFVILFAIAIHFLERPLLIIGTAVPGSYSTIWGIDIFVRTGFKDAVIVILQNQGKISVTTNVWIMIGSFIALSAISTCVQFFWSGKKHHNLGRSGYRNIDNDKEKN